MFLTDFLYLPFLECIHDINIKILPAVRSWVFTPDISVERLQLEFKMLNLEISDLNERKH